MDSSKTIEELVRDRNGGKLLFTPGPASLLCENIIGLRPCFGRGDSDYDQVEERVLAALKSMSGHGNIARFQGSASLALEIMALNFLYGRVLVVSTGYYSDRLHFLANSALRQKKQIKEIVTADWREINNLWGRFDWILACYTETSRGIKLEIEALAALANRTSARLMLDATASIGLEKGHEIADVIGYSSCKGLFGLTGAGFVAFNNPPTVEVDSFYLRLQTHLDKSMTGPYHAIASLVEVLPKHEELKQAVFENKRSFIAKASDWITVPEKNQPQLCTQIKGKISFKDSRSIPYMPRGEFDGSVVCHLGEVHLGKNARGEILNEVVLPSNGDENN